MNKNMNRPLLLFGTLIHFYFLLQMLIRFDFLFYIVIRFYILHRILTRVLRSFGL